MAVQGSLLVLSLFLASALGQSATRQTCCATVPPWLVQLRGQLRRSALENSGIAEQINRVDGWLIVAQQFSAKLRLSSRQPIPVAKGDDGPLGDTGEPGNPGIDGQVGSRGEKGDRGRPGAGVSGQVGSTGPPGGEGLDGARGATGGAGPSIGIVGPAGAKGHRGGSGSVGPPGPDGVQGAAGGIGPNGFPGYNGELSESCEDTCDPLEIENGDASYSAIIGGSRIRRGVKARISCRYGFVPSAPNSTETECIGRAGFEPEPSGCIFSCEELRITGASITYSELRPNGRVPAFGTLQLSCNDGYNARDPAAVSSRCLGMNEWVPPPTDCNYYCPRFEVPNGLVTLNGDACQQSVSSKEKARIFCHTDHVPSDPTAADLTCIAPARWHRDPTTCVPSCPLFCISNAILDLFDLVSGRIRLGGKVKVICSDGYDFLTHAADEVTVTCVERSDGFDYDKPMPACLPSCKPFTVENGRSLSNEILPSGNYPVGATVTITCQANHHLPDNPGGLASLRPVCVGPNTYRPMPIKRCVPSCHVLEEPVNAMISYSNNPVDGLVPAGTTAIAMCTANHCPADLSNVKSLCRENHVWELAEDKMTLTSCFAASIPCTVFQKGCLPLQQDNANVDLPIIVTGVVAVGSTTRITCVDGYVFDDVQVISPTIQRICKADLTYDPVPACIPSCPLPMIAMVPGVQVSTGGAALLQGRVPVRAPPIILTITCPNTNALPNLADTAGGTLSVTPACVAPNTYSPMAVKRCIPACLTFSSPANGMVVFGIDPITSRVPAGTWAFVMCNPGYCPADLDNLKSRCNDHHTWTPAPPLSQCRLSRRVCEATGCLPLLHDHAIVTPPLPLRLIPVGMSVTVECAQGYIFDDDFLTSNSLDVQCRPDSTFPPVPACVPTCAKPIVWVPPGIAAAAIAIPATLLQDRIPSDSAPLTITCPASTAPDLCNGKLTITPQCVGPEPNVFQPMPIKSCVRLCPVLPGPMNPASGMIVYSVPLIGSFVPTGTLATVMCADGFCHTDLNRLKTMCQMDGTWTTLPPLSDCEVTVGVCEAVGCLPLLHPNAIITLPVTLPVRLIPVGMSVTVECSEGYMFDDASVATNSFTAECLDGGIFPPVPDCVPSCTVPAVWVPAGFAAASIAIPDGLLQGIFIRSGDSALTITCPSGTLPEHCRGKLSTRPRCVGSAPNVFDPMPIKQCVIACPLLPAVANGAIMYNTPEVSGTHVSGTVAMLICDSGFYPSLLTGIKSTCLSNRWSNDLSACEPGCAVPDVPFASETGQLIIAGSVPFGATITISCDNNADMQDVVCQNDGTFSPAINPCPPPIQGCHPRAFPYGPALGDNTITFDDATGGFVTIPLGAAIPFFGPSYTHLEVNANGRIAFHDDSGSFCQPIVPSVDEPRIYAWGSDPDPSDGGIVYWRFVPLTSPEACLMLTLLQEKSLVDGFLPTAILLVTWDDIPCYSCGNTANTNCWQAAVVSNGVQTFVIFLYGQIEWPLPENTDGPDCTGSGPDACSTSCVPFIGFNGGDGTQFFEQLPGSQSAVDARLMNMRTNVGEAGVWIYEVSTSTVHEGVGTIVPTGGPCNFAGCHPRAFPYGPALGDNSIIFDDATGGFVTIPLGATIPFFGPSYTHLEVNANGRIAFHDDSGSFCQPTVPSAGEPRIYAWGTDPNPGLGGIVYWRFVPLTSPTACLMLTLLHEKLLIEGTFFPTAILLVTWEDIPCYSCDSANTNCWQATVVSDGVQTFVVFLYGQIEWPLAVRTDAAGCTGSGPNDCPTSCVPFIGFNGGDGSASFEETPGSRSAVDARTMNVRTNVGEAGVWIYEVSTSTVHQGVGTISPTGGPCIFADCHALTFPFGPAEGDATITCDDCTSGFLPSGISIPFYGASYTSFEINDNGRIAFHDDDGSFCQPDPPSLSPDLLPRIYTWATDTDSGLGGSVFWRAVSLSGPTSCRVRKLLQDKALINADTFSPAWILLVTWANIPCYDCDPEFTNCWQTAVVTDGVQLFVINLYGQIEWPLAAHSEPAGCSGAGPPGECSTSCVPFIGFDFGDGTNFFEETGSRTTAGVRMMNTLTNIGEPGAWIYEVSTTTIHQGLGTLASTGTPLVCP